MLRGYFNLCLIALSSALFLSACASGTFKARQEQRERMASSAGLYCEFVNGDQFPDVDVELNMQMARRCDANRPFSITNYKNASEKIGVLYCCAMQGSAPRAPRKVAKPAAPVTPATQAPAAAPKEEIQDDVTPE